MAGIGIAAVEAAGAIGSNVASGLFGYNQAAKNRAFQERMYYQQLADNRENWEMANKYNLPSAQVQRLKDANLNPLLMYGEGGLSGNLAGVANGASAPNGAMSNTHFDNPLRGLSSNLSQMELLDAQKDDVIATAEMKKAQARRLNLESDITEATKNVQIAMKYSDLDLLNESIRKIAADRYNDALITAEQAATLAQGRIYQIKQYNLSEQEVANALMLGLENVAIGKTNASAAYKNACANLQRAMTEAYLAPSQKALLVENAAKLANENKLFNDTYSDRKWIVHSQARSASFQAAADSWLPVLRESGISVNQSNIFLNTLKGEMIKTDIGQKEMDMMLTPVDMLLNMDIKK